ncbi:MAG: lipoate--protein ligase family protein, partial [Firmicutes bacterium]|nr:lipoate--protein ligase family protein [Bacillota bacterium]
MELAVDVYDLGPVNWWESQCYYHALAHLGREGLIICSPASPYVCLGLHDDLEQEIDPVYCQEQNIPIFRRETGGGVVYLDDRQVFFQLILRRDNPRLPLRRQRFYEEFLQPAIAAYQHFGVPAELKAPADIAAAGRKCSGNACGDVGECVAYVGNILLDFDFS